MFYDGIPATPNYAGMAPTLVGVYQVNVTIPANAPTGGTVPLWLEVGTSEISNTVLIAIQ